MRSRSPSPTTARVSRADVMDSLGEPYVTTRPASAPKKEGEHSGLGLGFFIAKTLLERSGATLSSRTGRRPRMGPSSALLGDVARSRCRRSRSGSAATTDASDTW